MNELQTQSTTFNLTPTSLSEAMDLANLIAESDICPKDYQKKAGNVLVAVQMGAELGLQPMQALQNIAVINGRPSVWGDSMLALAMANPAFEDIKETFDDDTMTATCVIKRKGMSGVERKFSQEDAVQANLWSKSGPWKQYPKRMLQMRARGFCLRDAFPDALRGLITAEEAVDLPPEPEKDITSTSTIVVEGSRTDALAASLEQVDKESGEIIQADDNDPPPIVETEEGKLLQRIQDAEDNEELMSVADDLSKSKMEKEAISRVRQAMSIKYQELSA